MKYHFDDSGATALNNLISNLKPSSIFVLTDDNTQKYCLPVLSTLTNFKFTNVNIKAGDKFKNLDTLSFVWQELMDYGADRKSLMINLGGGVITDIGGFAAATFKRGIKFVHIPTTLLGMVDAAIGGKNGVNFTGQKNQIGTIVPPEMLWIYPAFLKTLPPGEFDSGFAEMLKHGLITDVAYWNDLIRYYSAKDNGRLNSLIKKSVEIKDAIITKDPKEQNIRKLLNFGHTLGHGIESYMNYQKKVPVSHGKAVAVGMILAAFLSHKINKMPISEVDKIKNVINGIYPKLVFESDDILEIIHLLRHDKKNIKGKVLFVLLHKTGKAACDFEVPEKFILEAFDYYNK